MTVIPYLMPLALLAYAGYLYWAQAQRSAEIDSAAWALREGLVPGTRRRRAQPRRCFAGRG